MSIFAPEVYPISHLKSGFPCRPFAFQFVNHAISSVNSQQFDLYLINPLVNYILIQKKYKKNNDCQW